MSSLSTNSIVPGAGEMDFNIPDTKPDTKRERRTASLAKSSQWKDQLEYLDQREELYRAQIPGGLKYNQMTKDDAAFYGAVGNAVIEEMRLWKARAEGSLNAFK